LYGQRLTNDSTVPHFRGPCSTLLTLFCLKRFWPRSSRQPLLFGTCDGPLELRQKCHGRNASVQFCVIRLIFSRRCQMLGLVVALFPLQFPVPPSSCQKTAHVSVIIEFRWCMANALLLDFFTCRCHRCRPRLSLSHYYLRHAHAGSSTWHFSIPLRLSSLCCGGPLRIS
jgi:hypothetical protein